MTDPRNIIGAQVYIRGCSEIGKVSDVRSHPKRGDVAFVWFIRGGIETWQWWPVTDVMLVEPAGANP
jgi:hypothetical protein